MIFLRSRIAVLFIFPILLLSVVSLAVEEQAQASFLRPVSLPAGQVMDRDYFAFGPLVEVSGTVNGDVYALGGQVLVDGKVNGDLLVAGGRVSVSGEVAQDLRIAGGQMSVSFLLT